MSHRPLQVRPYRGAIGEPWDYASVLIDGNNVMGSRPDGWWRDRVAAARRLTGQVQALPWRPSAMVLVFFDGPDRTGDGWGPLPSAPALAHPVYSGPRSADELIAAAVADPASARPVLVVTSDRPLARTCRLAGADVMGAGQFASFLLKAAPTSYD